MHDLRRGKDRTPYHQTPRETQSAKITTIKRKTADGEPVVSVDISVQSAVVLTQNQSAGQKASYNWPFRQRLIPIYTLTAVPSIYRSLGDFSGQQFLLILLSALSSPRSKAAILSILKQTTSKRFYKLMDHRTLCKQ